MSRLLSWETEEILREVNKKFIISGVNHILSTT